MKKVGGQVLVVDDDIMTVELLLSVLGGLEGVEQVNVVEDGEEALEYLWCRGRHEGRETGHPAVILLDVKMPKVDGIEVLRRIKSDPGMGSIPVVILTSSREPNDLAASYALGVNSYVVKPVDFEEFVGVIKTLGRFWVGCNQTLDPGVMVR